MIIPMVTFSRLTVKHCRMLLASIFVIALPAIATGQIMQEEAPVATDLNIALTLQGINCDGIGNLEKTGDAGYEVVCNEGGHYSISETANGLLKVVDDWTGRIFSLAGRLFGVIPRTGQVHQTKDKANETDVEVARSLFSIIELSGHVCEAITSVVKRSTDDHFVTCENGAKYHVYTLADGQVAVEEDMNL